jgi:hypothetical protein
MQAGAIALSAIAAIVASAPSAGADVRAHSNDAPQWEFRNNDRLAPDSVVISGTVFPRDGVNLSVGQTLPYATNYGSTVPEPAPVYAQAVADGQYPYIFNNDGPDGSFAVQTPIDLWDVSLWGRPLGTVHVPTDQMTTSFSSKSELAINLATGGQDLSFSGYGAGVGTFDVSNSSTPGTPDLTNPDLAGSYYRVTGDIDSAGQWTFTRTNSYSGDNERAVALDSADGQFFASGNSNNGNSSPVNPALVDGTGAQDYAESFLPEASQTPAGGTSLVPMGQFSINNLSIYATHKADKAGKDTNFRGLTVFDNVVYYTKGSGGNGINTVYYVDTTAPISSSTIPAGTCANGTGIPAPGAALPQPGVQYKMCVLAGFNTALAKTDTAHFPFGIWFANADTLYLADEGSGGFGDDPNSSDPTNPYADAAASTTAGLQKWSFKGSRWVLDYTLQNGLDLGQPYSVKGYPTGDNDTEGGSGLPWAPATDGLRNISGHVNGDGTATIYATTSTVSGSGDQGADPNKVVAITDALGAIDPATARVEQFTTIRQPVDGVRYGGVAVLPSDFGSHRSGWLSRLSTTRGKGRWPASHRPQPLTRAARSRSRPRSRSARAASSAAAPGRSAPPAHRR